MPPAVTLFPEFRRCGSSSNRFDDVELAGQSFRRNEIRSRSRVCMAAVPAFQRPISCSASRTMLAGAGHD